jgi:quinol monooxygenase YgiN
MQKTTAAMILLITVIVSIGVARPEMAQGPDGARQAVAYVDVTRQGVAAAVAAFRRYRDAAAREPGFVAFDLFEQIGREGHFVVIDSWRDQAAYDAHQAAPALANLQEALQPIRTSGYDLRPYRELSVSPSRPGGPNVIAVVAHVDIGGGAQKLDVPAMLRSLAEASRAERGCLRFDVTQHTMRANHFTVVETWEDQQALDRHTAAPHTKRFRDEVQPVSGSPIDERVYKRVE